MGIVKSIKKRIKNYIKSEIKKELEKNPNEIKKYIENKLFSDEYIQIIEQMIDFKNASDDNLASKVESKTNVKDLIKRFKKIGITVIEEAIDLNDFKNWVKEFYELEDYYKNHGIAKIEKLLEYYLTYKYLNISKNNVYIDIAACNSIFANLLNKKLSITAYEQDLIYDNGINGNKIGCDASNIPVKNEFADILSLQCAFECFQGESDINFIKEARRILKKEGKLGIIPLYVDNVYFIKTGPKYDRRKIRAEKEARLIWRDDEWESEPFSRHYSPESFNLRIFKNLENMKGEILYFTNLEEFRNEFKDQSIYCNFMFRAIKY